MTTTEQQETTVPGHQGTLSQRIARTYLGLLVGPLLGLGVGAGLAAVMATSATSYAMLPVIFVVGLVCVLGGWGAGVWHTRRLELGEPTVWCAALAPVLVLVIGATLQSWLFVLALVVVLPLLVALLAGGRWGAAALTGTALVALVVAAFLGRLPLDGGMMEDRTVDALRAGDVEPFVPQTATGTTPTDVRVDDDVLRYTVEDADLTHAVTITRRPAGSEPIAGLAEGRTPTGEALRYDEGMLITVESRGADGEVDTPAAIELVGGLQAVSPRAFARAADL